MLGTAGFGVGCYSCAEPQELPFEFTGAGFLHTGVVVGLWFHLDTAKLKMISTASMVVL